MATLFISDLHLSEIRPKTTELFLNFLSSEAKTAEALYILGDFFEAWIGDDNQNPHDLKIIQALANLSQQGIPLYFMHGNRDFLLGKRFLQETGGTLLKDPTVIQLYQERILLTHGDKFCTLDRAYQIFRRFVQNPLTKKLYLSLPLSWRRQIAAKLRQLSIQGKKSNSHLNHSERWDVVQKEVDQSLQKNNACVVIHGHTHKPGIHEWTLDNKLYKRIVLGDWGLTGSVLMVEPNSLQLKVIQ